MHTEFVARRHVRILGHDYQPDDVINDPAIPTHVLATLTSTRRIAQRISRGDEIDDNARFPLDETGARRLSRPGGDPYEPPGPAPAPQPEPAPEPAPEPVPPPAAAKPRRTPQPTPEALDALSQESPAAILKRAPSALKRGRGRPRNHDRPPSVPRVGEPAAPDLSGIDVEGIDLEPWRGAWQSTSPSITFRNYLMSRAARMHVLKSGSVRELVARLQEVGVTP